jgi:hypothetical protein
MVFSALIIPQQRHTQPQQQMSETTSFGDLETPNWAMQPPASFQLVHDSEFPALGPAASKHSKPLTAPTAKRPVAAPKLQAAPQQPAPVSPQLTHRALVIEESAHALQLALSAPKPKRTDHKSKSCDAVCNLQTRMQFMRSSSGCSFTSDACPLPKDLDISKCRNWSELAAEVSIKLHAALVRQCGNDFTVSVRFSKDKLQHTVSATVMW